MSFKILTILIVVINNVYSKQVRIIGGTDAATGEFPYHALLRRINDNSLVCNGAIISPFHILTAAHCVHEQFVAQNNLKISLGGRNRNQHFTSEHIPIRFYIHPNFVARSDVSMTSNYDIAVIKTRDQIYFDQNQRMIQLPTRNIVHGDVAIFSGWGTITHPMITLPLKLQKTNVIVVEPTICQLTIPVPLYDDQFCTHTRVGIGGCLGDGGSPLVKNGEIIGIFSICISCANGVPDVYTNVYAVMPFIRSVLII